MEVLQRALRYRDTGTIKSAWVCELAHVGTTQRRGMRGCDVTRALGALHRVSQRVKCKRAQRAPPIATEMQKGTSGSRHDDTGTTALQ
jgi:hypothetical protein